MSVSLKRQLADMKWGLQQGRGDSDLVFEVGLFWHNFARLRVIVPAVVSKLCLVYFML